MAYLGQTGKHWTSGVVPRLSEPPIASTEPPPVYTMLQRLPDAAVGPERELLWQCTVLTFGDVPNFAEKEVT